MTGMPWPLLRQLARAIGVSLRLPPPLSQAEVERVLERWMVGGAAGGRFAAVATRPNEEPGWLLWSCRVAQLVDRCPWHRMPERSIPWAGPAVEVGAFVHAALVHEENALASRERAAVLSGSKHLLHECAQQRMSIETAWRLLDSLRATKPYRDGISYLAQELAIVREDDGRIAEAFNTWEERS